LDSGKTAEDLRWLTEGAVDWDGAANSSEAYQDCDEGQTKGQQALPESNEVSASRIYAGNGHLAEVTTQAWEALQRANVPPALFRYGAAPARIESDDDGNPLVRAMTQDRMRHRLARVANWFTIAKKGE